MVLEVLIMYLVYFFQKKSEEHSDGVRRGERAAEFADGSYRQRKKGKRPSVRRRFRTEQAFFHLISQRD